MNGFKDLSTIAVSFIRLSLPGECCDVIVLDGTDLSVLKKSLENYIEYVNETIIVNNIIESQKQVSEKT